MKIFKRVISYALHYRFLFFVSFFFAFFLAFVKVLGALQVGNFFSENFIGANFEKINIISVLILVLLGIAYAGLQYLIFLSSNSLAVSVMHDIRKDVFSKLIDLPLSYYKKNRTGDILSRILNDIGTIEIFFMNIMVDLLLQPLTFVLIICLMFYMNTRISIYFFSIVPILALILAGLGSLVQKLSANLQKNISSITSNIQETVYGIEVIKGFGVESDIREKFLTANDRHLKSGKRELRVRLLGTPVSMLIGVIEVIIILVMGALSVKNGLATSSQIVNFLFLVAVLAEPLSRMNELVMIPRKLYSAAQRVFEIIDSKEHEDFSKPDIGMVKGRIEFKSLNFEYDPGFSTLTNIDLVIEEGETVAIIGPSGAGKSSLISLIPGFYMPAPGSIFIDGKDVCGYSPLSIRKQIGLVTQENILFSGTIFDNIKFSNINASETDVLSAAALANAHQFISRLKDGYQTILGDRGVTISGGEKQRIALARAILRKPRILILDEATSSLDVESEKLIRTAMNNILGKQTTIIVTHKLSTIAYADKIVVMEEGKIKEIGDHRSLVEKNGLYKRLIGIQV